MLPPAGGTEDCGAQARVLAETKGLDDWVHEIVAQGSPIDEVETETRNPAAEMTESKPKVRPIQMGEFLRKFTCKRLGAVDRSDVAAICASLRQFGCGISGGAEAMIHFRNLVMEH